MVEEALCRVEGNGGSENQCHLPHVFLVISVARVASFSLIYQHPFLDGLHMGSHPHRQVVADRAPHMRRPIWLLPLGPPLASVNQRLPSGPVVIPAPNCASKALWGAGRGNSVIVPLGVMRPILLPLRSAEQRVG